MLVLGIETSCDETAVALVDETRHIRANLVLSQIEEHRPYGGVVPEIAARAHVEHIDRLVAQAMAEAGANFSDLDGVAATAGPGLIGGVMVGLMTGKAIAAVHALPLAAVNHLEGHALSARLSDGLDFPYLLLLISGGHCQLLVVQDVGAYTRLGTTIDDAVGEAFDKTAKMLGLGYPGGPAVERAAREGDAQRFDFPRPLKGRDGCHFSFSGLKTAVWYTVKRLGGEAKQLSRQMKADLAASFQAAVADVLCDRTENALATMRERYPDAKDFVVAGGVAANELLRARLAEVSSANGFTMTAPPPALCTDNGAMIAWAGVERLSRGLSDPLDAPARARWPLDPHAAKAPGAGAKE